MKKITILISAAIACISLAGCEYEGRRAYGYGEVGVAYDGYYDNYYGPFYDGYWSGDGFFYYRDHPDHDFRRDEGGHFRRNTAQGFHGFRGKLNAEHHGDHGDHGDREHHEH